MRSSFSPLLFLAGVFSYLSFFLTFLSSLRRSVMNHHTVLFISLFHQGMILKAQEVVHVRGDWADLIRTLSTEPFKDKHAIVSVGNVDYCEPCRNLSAFFEEFAKSDPNNVYVELKVLTQPVQFSQVMKRIRKDWDERPEGFTYASDINQSEEPTFAIPSIIMLTPHDNQQESPRQIVVDTELKRLRIHTSGLFKPVAKNRGVDLSKKVPNFFLYRNIDPTKDDKSKIAEIPTFIVLKSWIAETPYVPYAKYHVCFDGVRYFYELKEKQGDENLPEASRLGLGDLDLSLSFKVQEYMDKILIQKCTQDTCETLCVLENTEFKLILFRNGLEAEDVEDMDEETIRKIFAQKKSL